MTQAEEIKLSRLNDIKNMKFENDLNEITSTLTIILTMYENDDDPEIIGACKAKMEEGINLLDSLASEFKSKITGN